MIRTVGFPWPLFAVAEPTAPSAAEAVADADGRLPDFDVFCATVEATQDSLFGVIEG